MSEINECRRGSLKVLLLLVVIRGLSQAEELASIKVGSLHVPSIINIKVASRACQYFVLNGLPFLLLSLVKITLLC